MASVCTPPPFRFDDPPWRHPLTPPRPLRGWACRRHCRPPPLPRSHPLRRPGGRGRRQRRGAPAPPASRIGSGAVPPVPAWVQRGLRSPHRGGRAGARQPRACPSCRRRLAQRGGRAGWGAGCVSLFCGTGVRASSMPFLLPPRHPCCARPWGNGRTTEGRGCEHDRARPPYKTPVHPTFRMPPCARRPACGTTRAGHSKGGVRRDLVRGTTRGRAHTRCGRGVPAPILAAPPIAPVRAPLPVHARMGAPLCTPFTQAGRGQKRWGGGYASRAGVSVPR